MSDRDTCRNPGCDRPSRDRTDGVDGYGARFCSTGCELTYSHRKADAREARRDAARAPGGQR